MYSEEKIVLKIRARGNVELRKIIDFLKDFESAYNRIYTISNFSGDARFFPDFSERTGKIKFQKGEISPFKYELKFASESEIKNSIPQQDILLLKRVVLESPGVWEIIGSLNPMETIRKFINDHDNRKKDRDLHPHRVRSAELDIIEKEDNIFFNRINEFRKLGMSEKEIHELITKFRDKPLLKLDKYIEEGLIENAEVIAIAEQSEVNITTKQTDIDEETQELSE